MYSWHGLSMCLGGPLACPWLCACVPPGASSPIYSAATGPVIAPALRALSGGKARPGPSVAGQGRRSRPRFINRT